MLDTLRHVETPEGIRIGLHAAGALPRARAWAIDALIRFAILVACTSILGLFGATGMAAYLLLLFGLLWGYWIIFEALWRGQTPGKKACGLRVVAADGAPVGWLAAITRTLLRTADMLPFGYAIGLLACWFDPWGRRLGDLAANTLVVYVEPKPEPPAQISAPPLDLPLALRREERMALVAFAERAHLLTEERQQELADLLGLLTHARGQAAVLRLQGMARALLGSR